MNKYKQMKQEHLNYQIRYIKVTISDLIYFFFEDHSVYHYLFSIIGCHDIPVFTLNKCYGKRL